MILKGSQRRGPVDLALHLSNSVDNERVHIAEIRGAISDNLYDAFREWALICDQSSAKDPFYSLSINPDPTGRTWSDQEWQRAINHIEERLGLCGQPRAIIFHEKIGESDGNLRKHCHVVWSRITIKTDNRQAKAVHLSHDYYKLATCARELAKEFGLELRYGQRKDNSEAYDHARSHGKNCDPHTAQVRQALLTRLWRETDTPQGFCIAAAEAGYVIAQGERRAFVVVDNDMQVHALARQLEGINTKQVKERLGDAGAYPSIEQAKEEIRIRKSAGETLKQARTDLSREQRLYAKLRTMAKRADRLHETRRKALLREQAECAKQHRQEADALKRQYRAADAKALQRRYQKQPSGMVKTFCDTVGITAIMRWLDAQEDFKCKRIFEQRRQTLKTLQKSEAERLARKQEILLKQECREARAYQRLAQKIAIKADWPILARDPPTQRQSRSVSMRIA